MPPTRPKTTSSRRWRLNCGCAYRPTLGGEGRCAERDPEAPTSEPSGASRPARKRLGRATQTGKYRRLPSSALLLHRASDLAADLPVRVLGRVHVHVGLAGFNRLDLRLRELRFA